MKPLLNAMLLVAACTSASGGQSLELQKSGMATAGGSAEFYTQNGPYFISYSIGQHSPVTGLQHNDLYLLQGFEHISLNRSVMEKEELYVFPNPTGGPVTVYGKVLATFEEITLSLVSTDGRTVREDRVITTNDRVIVDYTRIKRGMYILKLGHASREYFRTKVVLQ